MSFSCMFRDPPINIVQTIIPTFDTDLVIRRASHPYASTSITRMLFKGYIGVTIS